ncbi:MAG: hypothetical protein JWM57_447 [Phycisphaerales bacterium]|nr:hypothetical protein [Phycisphaerales bacterium]
MESFQNDKSEEVQVSQWRRLSRSGLPALICILLLTSTLVGAAAISDVSTNMMDVAKIVSVVAFIAAMVALAMGMIGSAYRS